MATTNSTFVHDETASPTSERRTVADRESWQMVLWTALVLLSATVLVGGLLSWSAARMDSRSIERQEQLVAHVLGQSAAKLAREQEFLMFKDNAVRLVTNPIVKESDIQVLHNNAGPRLHTYYGHDEAYVLAGGDDPITAMRNGVVEPPERFATVRGAAQPLISAVRAMTRRIPIGKPLASMPGAYDVTVVNGHPAILSVKAVISPTGRMPQPPGREALVISVVRLDGQFLESLERHYLLKHARFAWTNERRAGEASSPFLSPLSKRVVGYFIWQPFTPGSAVLKDMIAPLILTLLLVAGIVSLLIRRIGRTTAGFLRQHEISDVALNNMAQGLCMFDSDHRLVICNRRYVELYELPDRLAEPGTHGNEVLNYHLERGFNPVETRNAMDDLLSDWATIRPNSEVELPDGRIVNIQRRALRDGGWVSTHEDVTENRRAAQEIVYLANHDPLTGLPNRASFREQLQRCISLAERGHEFALHCVDLDRFKAVNDTLGHAAGDDLLRQVASRLRQVVRKSDFVTRLGGDEFAILQYPLDRSEKAGELAARVVEILGKPFHIEGHEAAIGASLGIALAPTDAIEAAVLLQKGDLALYRAKTDGRNTFCFFEPGMDSLLHERRVMETELRAALQKGEFELFYQPVVNLESGAIASFEALLRWRHPIRGIIEPAEFIPLTEESGLIIPIGEWVLRHACREAATWPDEIQVSVNVSPVQFKNRKFAALVMSAVTAANIAPQRLELEITESLLLQDSGEVLTILHQLRDAGIGIAMDDFGTGYSSLSYLRSFPFDRIKIDRSFVRDVVSQDDCLAIVHATAELSGKLGMRTTAEGVETAAQLDIMRAEGCTDIQGYYISEPVPAHMVQELLARDARPKPRAARQAG